MLGQFIIAIAQVLGLLIDLYVYILIARALISWVNPDPYNPIVKFLHNVTDPLLYRVRSLVPLYFSGIDFSPIAVLIALQFIKQILLAFLYSLAQGM